MRWLLLLLTTAALSVVNAETGPFKGVKSEVTISVIDDKGAVVEGAMLDGGYYSPYGKNYAADLFTGCTDTNGVYMAKGIAYQDMGFRLRKSGYYQTEGKYDFPELKDHEHLPKLIRAKVTMILNKIRNPIPMYAKKVETVISVPNQSFGYDLINGDLVNPYGAGVVSDIVFRLEGYCNDFRDNDSTLSLKFGQVNDGIIPMRTNRDRGVSDLKTPHAAPVEGYTNKLERHVKCEKAKTQFGFDKVTEDYDVNMNYVFRIRSRTNGQGVVINAYYGKMCKDIQFYGASSNGSFLIFRYYLNPTPNDRNLEFDPKKNLFKDLKPGERVTEP